MADPQDRAAAPCYDARALTRMYDHLTTVSRHMNTLGWANYANDHEDANGQFEQNFRYADPLTTADRVIVFRYMVHSLAAEAGMLATFMPKPFSHLTGNGLHMHLSLWDAESEGDELFADPDGRPGSRHVGARVLLHRRPARARRGTGGGRLPHGELLQAVGQRRPPNSGAAWSPVYATYGGNDRTHMLRVPEPGRVEDRCIDGSANPYLALSALIAAGLDGIERGLDPGDPCELNLLALARARGVRPRAALHAHDAVARPRPPRERRRAARGPGQDARRRLRRLLRRHQASRGAGVPRRGHAVGARPLPAGLLTADRRDRPHTNP